MGRYGMKKKFIIGWLPVLLTGLITAASIVKTEAAQPKLPIRNITSAQFSYSINNPRQYTIPGLIRAGVVPHHVTAAPMISGFFSQAAYHAEHYDTVVIIGPNHEGDLGDIIISNRDWDINGGVTRDEEFINRLKTANNFNIIVNNERMVEEHSASILIPYVNYYLPDTQVVAILVSRSLSFNGAVDFSRLISTLAEELGRSILLVCSIDFSHFLTPGEARERDRVTEKAVRSKDYRLIHSFDSANVDSPAALNIFLLYLSENGMEPYITDRAEASEFMGYVIEETTSYFIITGYE
jgi:hypothetical protein